MGRDPQFENRWAKILFLTFFLQKVTDLKWFSVWCREFEVILGDLIFPPNFSFDKIVFPGQPFHDDEEAEAEGEAEPEHNNSWQLQPQLFNVLIMALIFALNY
jgi:hypothetical protein